MNDYGNWFFVLFNIILFLYFINSAFKPRTKTDWKTFRIFGAFVVALFAEMYGFPLTIYLLTSFFGNKLGIDFTHNNGHLLNTLLGIKGDPHFSFIHILSNVFIFGGILFLGSAWKHLYQATKEGKLAMSGAYRYIRHPQYSAFILIIIGFLLQWPTIITLVMAPILIFRYILLAHTEERIMMKTFGPVYSTYSDQVPAFFPSLKLLLHDAANKLMTTKTVERG